MPPAKKPPTRPVTVPVGSLPEGAGFAVPDLGITGEFLGLSGADAKVRFTRGGSSKVEVQHWTAACPVLRDGAAAVRMVEDVSAARPAAPKPSPAKAAPAHPAPVQRPAPKAKPPAVVLEEVIHVAPKIERLV